MATLNFTTVRWKDTAGVRNRRVFLYTGPASYATNGDPLTAQDIGLGVIEFFPDAVAFNAALTPDSYHLVYDYTNAKVIWVDGASGNEVGAATDLSSLTVRLEVVGR